jgi:hypothetical protein
MEESPRGKEGFFLPCLEGEKQSKKTVKRVKLLFWGSRQF